ncbi:MAG: BspA family leucine-rich repeat surface protein [Eggerthellaceae bacterium]|nr:BspA family leucine-rich repeat surface protein [Eggerthellaceae bacterium]
MIKKISYAGIAVALIVATTPNAWAENAASGIEPKAASPAARADEVAATPGWNLIGTCEWAIDEFGCLIIRPAGNRSEGILPNNGSNPDAHYAEEFWPWLPNSSKIKALKIEGRIICGESAHYLFWNFKNITGIEGLTNLITENTRNMSSMFSGCSSLTSIDLSGFDTSSAVDIGALFCDCSSLTSIDLSGFDTSNVTGMGFMFSGCSSLTSLDLSGFDTSNVTEMVWMLEGCSSLTSLDLSGFDTSKVVRMNSMFEGCSSLSSLDLSHFDTPSLAGDDISGGMADMFSGCASLRSLDLSGFDTRHAINSWNVFSGTPLEFIDIGENFTLQKELPNKTWYNAAGQTFTPDTIPTGVAGAYATSMDWLEDLTVSLFESEKTVPVSDEPFTLVATVTPSVKAEDPVWTSSNPDVASVDSTGTVTVHKAGTATITATVKDAHDSCLVTVNPLVIGSTGNSSAEGQLTVEDAETAKTLKGYSLLIRPSVHKGSADFERRLLADVAQQQGKAGAIADLLDVCFADSTTGVEMDPSVAESLPPLDLSINLDDNLKALTAKNVLGLWAVSDSGDAAKAASLEGDHFQTLATVPGTYAIIATTKAGSTVGDGSSSNDGNDSTSGNGSGNSNGNGGDANQGSNTGSGNTGVNNPSGSLTGSANGSGADSDKGSATVSSPKADRDKADKTLPRTGDPIAPAAAMTFALSLVAAFVAAVSGTKLRALRRLRLYRH